MRFDIADQSAHRKVLIIGSGESGFKLLTKLRWHWNFESSEVGMVTNQPVHRTRYGLPLYATRYYLPIDFERPLLKDFKNNTFDFDEAVAIYPEDKVLQLFWGTYLTYDYLFLACGREVDPERLPPQFFEESAEELSNLFDMSDFLGYKKLLKRLEFLTDDDQINVISLPDSNQTEEAINLALLLKYVYKRNKVRLYLGQSAFRPNEPTLEKLTSYLESRGVEAITDKTPVISTGGTRTAIDLMVELADSPQYNLVFPAKRVPAFLADTPELAPDNFDPGTLVNRTYPNVFGLGSFLYPESGYYEKGRQMEVAFANFHAFMGKEWFERESPQTLYQPNKELLVFEHFTKVLLLREDEFRKGAFESKRRAWRLLNSEIFRHFYWLRWIPRHYKHE